MLNAMDYPAEAIFKSVKVVFHAVQDILAAQSTRTRISQAASTNQGECKEERFLKEKDHFIYY